MPAPIKSDVEGIASGLLALLGTSQGQGIFNVTDASCPGEGQVAKRDVMSLTTGQGRTEHRMSPGDFVPVKPLGTERLSPTLENKVEGHGRARPITILPSPAMPNPELLSFASNC